MSEPEKQPDDQTAPSPLPPWEQPSPEARAAAEPAGEALAQALRAIKTPARAERAADELVAAAGDATAEQVREQTGGASPEPAAAIEAAAATPGAQKAPAALLEAAQQIAGSNGETREALEQALQQVTSPAAPGQAADLQEPLALLRDAILRRMKPYQALDARVFLAINHLPHSAPANRLMYAVTTIMNGGWGWVIGLVLAAATGRRGAHRALRQVVPPLWFATMTVEYPIKYYFRRRRPFIDIVQAIAVGKKPGTFSFPSGHSAAAFAGAWLLRRHYPRLAPLWYAIAALVGFSRVYLGAHYPGDVLSGALSGTLIAEAARWAIDQADESD